jgi:DNA polymerase-3 subunit epsilon
MLKRQMLTFRASARSVWWSLGRREIVRQSHCLINPVDDFDPLNIAVHGITPEDVAGASRFNDVLPELLSEMHSRVVVHHTSFDRVAVSRAAQRFGLDSLPCTWLDSPRVARRAWERFAYRGYGLANLAAEFRIHFRHHDPLEDARAAGLVLLRAISETGRTLSEWLTRVEQPIAASINANSNHHACTGNPEGPFLARSSFSQVHFRSCVRRRRRWPVLRGAMWRTG